jgi:hypothetical protein
METEKIVGYEIDLSSLDINDWETVIENEQISITTGAQGSITTGAQGSTIPSGSYIINTSQFNGTSNYGYYSNNSSPTITVGSGGTTGLDVTGDAKFHGDIKWKGRSLGDMLETIEKRLAILTPDPEKLEHFEALQKAYQHYKTLEALCQVPKKEKE